MTPPEMLQTMQGCHPTSVACPAKVSVLKEAGNLTQYLGSSTVYLVCPIFPQVPGTMLLQGPL